MEKLYPSHLEKADEALRRAFRDELSTKSLTVILLLDTGPEQDRPNPPATSFASRATWRRELAAKMLGRIREAIAGTLEQLRGLGLDPQGWELGQAVVSGPADAIGAALALPGVKMAVLDWDVGLFDWLRSDGDTVTQAAPIDLRR